MSRITLCLLVTALASVNGLNEVQCPLPEEPVDEAAALCNGKCTGDNMYYCKPIDATYTCVCKLGYRYDEDTGRCNNVNECDENIHDCDATFRATCSDEEGSYKCECTSPRFTGDGHFCQAVDSNGCLTNCPTDRYCLKVKMPSFFGGGSFDMCICQSGYKVSDSGCVDIDECLDAKCDVNAVCVNTVPGYACVCKPGFEGNGHYCQDKNECVDGAPCGENADCVNTDGSYKCVCQYGYTGDGVDCTEICPDPCKIFMAQTTVAPPDVNECTAEAQSPCPSDAVCVNTIGSYYCRCELGYEWDYTTRSCVNIDECARGISGCAESWKATCEDTIGSYNCKCLDGFIGNGIYCSVVEKATCQTTCQSNQFCFKMTFAGFVSEICICQSGYKNSDIGCVDIEECNDEPFPCHPNATCIEREPGFTCECKEGFEGNGYFCQDKDECAPGYTNNCDTNANCVNSVGSYKCECQYGYTGDGVTCDSICPEPTTTTATATAGS